MRVIFANPAKAKADAAIRINHREERAFLFWLFSVRTPLNFSGRAAQVVFNCERFFKAP